MGAFKMTLPWRGSTVIKQVAGSLREAGLEEIVAVTGHRQLDVETALVGTGVRCVFNPDYANGEMLSSIQAGFGVLNPEVRAVLVCLGDQPQMEAATVRAILFEGERSGWQRVIIPSYRMRAGHPILIPTSLGPQIMNATESLRTALRTRPNSIDYLVLDTPTILADLDTPEDYAASAATER
jgi:molybdenum cofactor cytidylyltransferase